MSLSGSPCPLQCRQITAHRDTILAILPLSFHRPCNGFSLPSSLLSITTNSGKSSFHYGQGKLCRKSKHACFACTQYPKQPAERPFWPSFMPQPLNYSSSFADVNPVQLSELWLKTLRVKRDPKKIVIALRHSFAFVVVLAVDEDSLPTSSSGFKTVGVGRAVSDGIFIATICDVAVDPAYRNRGIGRRIVKKLVENIKRIGGPTGFVVFPPPLARRFFWMIGFRSDRKYKFMAYRSKSVDATVETIASNAAAGILDETENDKIAGEENEQESAFGGLKGGVL